MLYTVIIYDYTCIGGACMPHPISGVGTVKRLGGPLGWCKVMGLPLAQSTGKFETGSHTFS